VLRRYSCWFLFFMATLWNSISFMGGFYFPFFSPRYAFNPVAIRLKELWYWFVPGDFLLFVSLVLSLWIFFYFRTESERIFELMQAAGWLSLIKGILNTAAYAYFLGGISPSFTNIFSGIIIFLASYTLKGAKQ